MTNCVMFVSIIDEKYALIVDSTCFSAMRALICHVLLVVSIFYTIKGGRPVALRLACCKPTCCYFLGVGKCLCNGC